MQLDFHLWRFDWAGGPSGIGDGVADLAQRAEGLGVRTLSVMDHFFQMEAAAPPKTHARGLHGARLRRRPHPNAAPADPGDRRDLPPSGTARQDDDHARRGLGRAGGAGASEPPGTNESTVVSGCRFRLSPSASSDSRRRSRSASRCGATTTAPTAGRHYQLEETLCRPMPVSRPRPRIMIGGSGERKTLRLVAQYADACNIFGGLDEVAHKLDVLRGHCDALDRDPNEIEVTVMYRDFPPDTTTDDARARCGGVRQHRGVDARHRRGRRRPRGVARVDVRARDRATPRHRTRAPVARPQARSPTPSVSSAHHP